jgi:hypothetical protein
MLSWRCSRGASGLLSFSFSIFLLMGSAALSRAAPAGQPGCAFGSKAAINSNGNCLQIIGIIRPGEGNGDEKPPADDGREEALQNLSLLGQTFATAGMVASQVTQDIIAAALDGDITPDTAASGSVNASLFMVSGYKGVSHNGFSVSSEFGSVSGKTPEFDEDNYGLTIGTRFDGSKFFGAPAGSVTLGLIGNYTHTGIEVDAPADFPGLSKGGSADVDSFSFGGYGLVTDGQYYGLLTVTGTYGAPETSSTVVPANAEFDSFGVATSALAGVLVPIGESTKLDLRGGLNYVHATSDDYEDSIETLYTDGHMEEFSGTLSARIFTLVKGDEYNLRPFVQGGLNHRFHYENELKVNGETFNFDDADTSVFARAGVDFNIGKATQAYVAVRGDASKDFQAIAAQVGVTFKLD